MSSWWLHHQLKTNSKDISALHHKDTMQAKRLKKKIQRTKKMNTAALKLKTRMTPATRISSSGRAANDREESGQHSRSTHYNPLSQTPEIHLNSHAHTVVDLLEPPCNAGNSLETPYPHRDREKNPTALAYREARGAKGRGEHIQTSVAGMA
jgi:hypothetical protein